MPNNINLQIGQVVQTEDKIQYDKFQDKNTLLKVKTFIEYLILIAVGYFIFF